MIEKGPKIEKIIRVDSKTTLELANIKILLFLGPRIYLVDNDKQITVLKTEPPGEFTIELCEVWSISSGNYSYNILEIIEYLEHPKEQIKFAAYFWNPSLFELEGFDAHIGEQ